MWELGLFLFHPNPDYVMLPFDELLQKPHKLKKVGRRKEDGAEYVVVEYSREGEAECEVWFDPRVNYLVWKVIVKQTKSDFSLTAEHRVLGFAEVAPGIYCPEKVESYSGEKRRVAWLAAFRDIQVNRPLPAETFDRVSRPALSSGTQFWASPTRWGPTASRREPTRTSPYRRRPLFPPAVRRADWPNPRRAKVVDVVDFTYLPRAVASWNRARS